MAAVKESHQASKGKSVVVIGAGPAGLTAAYELSKHNVHSVVLEKYDKVGGIARTENYKGFFFDMGGHRFFSKVEEINAVWTEVLGDAFLRRPRTSRIYYKRRFFDYPVTPINALLGLGIVQAFLVILSYLRWQLFPYRQEETYEQWVTNRFGRRLFHTFFKSYTEKVWGIPCSELRAEWAAQRIKGLSLKTAVVGMFFTPKTTIKTLIREFYYPRYGPGMMWNAFRSLIESRGGIVRTGCDVVHIHRTANRITRVVVADGGREESVFGTDFISSMPITEFITKLEPAPPPPILEAAKQLKYRDFLTVCLVINQPHLFPDNWIYIHDPSVKVGRIQNFKNWSPDMVPDPNKTSLGLEYFCNEGDGIWSMADDDLIELAKREVDQIRLARLSDVEDGCVFRVEKSYPVYDSAYRQHLAVIRAFVDRFENFQTIGRNGLHRYNNQDHAMLTGLGAVRNLILGEKNDLWSINGEQEYHEEVASLQNVENGTMATVDRRMPGITFGVVTGAVLSVATFALIVGDGSALLPALGSLSRYLSGYAATPVGVLVGLVSSFTCGFACGWVLAAARNAIPFISTRIDHRVRGRKRERLAAYVWAKDVDGSRMGEQVETEFLSK